MLVAFCAMNKAGKAACESKAAQMHCASSCDPSKSGTVRVSLFAFLGVVRVISLSLIGLLEAVINGFKISERKRTAGAF